MNAVIYKFDFELEGESLSKLYLQQVEASRRMMLEELPHVLVLHLKCFVYDKSGGCQKVTKVIDFSTDLEILKGM